MTVTTALPPAPPVLDLDARLALAGAAMGARLDEAAVAWEVNTCHLTGAPDWREAVTVDAPAPQPEQATPVAALLKRARQRVLRDGWSRDAAHNGRGGMCLLETIRAEARSHQDEGEARILLRQALGGDPVPEGNRRLGGVAQAAHVLGTAANTAAQRGI